MYVILLGRQFCHLSGSRLKNLWYCNSWNFCIKKYSCVKFCVKKFHTLPFNSHSITYYVLKYFVFNFCSLRRPPKFLLPTKISQITVPSSSVHPQSVYHWIQNQTILSRGWFAKFNARQVLTAILYMFQYMHSDQAHVSIPRATFLRVKWIRTKKGIVVCSVYTYMYFEKADNYSTFTLRRAQEKPE